MAAVLALSLTACGGSSDGGGTGSGGTGSGGGGETQTSSAQNVYSAEEVVLSDEEGMLEDMSVEGLTFCDGRLYAKGFVFGEYDSGSHVLLHFAPDGSDLQYSLLMGGGMEDIIATTVGPDGNFYVARVSYGEENFEFSSEGVTFDEHASAEEPGEIDVTVEEAEEGEIAPGGPETAEEDTTVDGPVPVEEPEEEEGPEMEEFVTEGGDSPADEGAFEEGAAEGVTSPLDEFKDEASAANAENELTVTDVEEYEDVPYEEGSSSYALTCMASDGQELWSAPVQAPKDPEADFYINSIACTEEGILVSGSTGLELYSREDGSFIRTISSEQELQGATPFALADGSVAVLYYGSSGEEFDLVDLKTGELSGHYPVPAEIGMTGVFPGKSYQLLLAGTSGVYGMNLDGSGAVKILDFVDSDLDITAMTSIAEMDDGRLAVVVSDLTGTALVEILTKVDPETLANRKTITLGSYYLDYEVRKQVFAFNKQSQDVRISIVDYSQYDSEAGGEGMTKLNTDIASGSAPDILVLSGAMPVKSYIAKGVFEDLTPYFKQDEEISGTQYLTNVLDAFKTDGKMYAIAPSFYVNAIVGKTEDIGDGTGLTLDAVEQMVKEKGMDPARVFGVCTREDVLYQALELCGNQFIDWDQSTCKFDTPEFKKLLEFVAQFPAKIAEDFEEDTSADYRSGKSLLLRQSIGTFDEYVNLRYGVFGTDITMTGFPSQTPGNAVIFPQLQLAVNASSAEKDACWSFVRRFLLDDYQKTIEMYWPVSINALDEMANKAMEPVYYEDENGNQVEDHIIVNIGGEDIALPRISDTEVDQMYAFLKGLDSEAYFDTSVENIIVEEAAAFFEGQKSADDVAGVIQSRVQIYINENS